MTKISVRDADPSDVPELAALGTSVFLATYGDTTASDDIEPHVAGHFSERAIAAALAESNVRYLLASSGKRCAGFVKIVDGDVPPAVPVPNALEVQQLYVSTDFQRMGVGRVLMDTAVGHSKACGAGGIWLSVWTEADWATSFYSGYGFRALGQVPFTIGTTEYIDYLMWLPLNQD